MAAEVSSGSCVSLRAQLDSARLGLQRLERDIRRAALNTNSNVNANRYQPERNQDRSFQGPPNARGGLRLGKPNFFQDGPNNQRNFDDRLGKKRPQETKTVFSRLSARPSGDSDAEEESNFVKKPRLSSQVIRDLPTKQEVLKAQSGDEESKARNRRMFGSLLGTLQKFKQEAIVLQNKEDKKAQIEKKIEEQAKQEKENQKKERQNLFAEREIKKATIKALEAKMVRMREFEKWELAHTTMLGFIQTKGKPQIFWKPKKMTEAAEEKLNISKKNLEKIIEKKRQDVATELNAIEQRCLRNIRLPPGSQLRPASLFPSSETFDEFENHTTMETDEIFEHQENDRVNSSVVVVKQEKEENERKIKSSDKDVASNGDQISQEKQPDSKERNVENGNTGERWNREETESSSDENSVEHAEEHKDHSMDESSQHIEDNRTEDPGGVQQADAEKPIDEETTEVTSSAVETESNAEK